MDWKNDLEYDLEYDLFVDRMMFNSDLQASLNLKTESTKFISYVINVHII